MDSIDLETSLGQPQCPRCNAARIRPIAINGNDLLFDCPQCHRRARAQLPAIRKTLVYLDTSTVSNIASAKRAGNPGSKWLLLYEVLRESAADDVICGIDSSILRREAELSRHAADIVALSREFANSHPRRQLNVRNEQLFRALDRFLAGADPVRETSLPWQDAYEEDRHRWKELIRLDTENRYSRELSESIRVAKTNLNRDVTEIYAGYTANGLGFDDIQRAEARGFGHGIIADGRRAIKNRLSVGATNSDEGVFGLLPTTFDLIVDRIKQQMGLEYPEALEKATELLNGEHASTTPVADIGSRLHAAIAMAARGPKPRPPEQGDSADIAHIATFMPYADIFIVDRFFASQCNRSDIRLGDPYGTIIRSLGEREIDEFKDELGLLRAECSHAGLARRIHQSIDQGGYIQQRTDALRQSLRHQAIG